MIIVLVNMLFCFLGGKLLRFDLEEIILASNANIGGPTTAAGMAISQGWVKLIGPCMLVGTFGYVIGTWLGILVGSLARRLTAERKRRCFRIIRRVSFPSGKRFRTSSLKSATIPASTSSANALTAMNSPSH